MTIEDTIRQVVREEWRTVREEIRAALAELKKPAAAAEARLTVEQVAQRAGGVQPETVREWIRSGKLKAGRAGHRYLVASADLEAFLLENAPTKPEDLGADEHLSLLVDRIEATSASKQHPKRRK